MREEIIKMNSKQSKNLRYASISILTLCFCSFVVFLSNQKQESSDQANAYKRMNHYAQEMIERSFQINPELMEIENPGRGLASVGESTQYSPELLEGPVGLDPWGRPFHFLVKKNPQNPKVGQIVIWSAGEDSRLETTRDMVAEDHTSFSGDDFGKVIPFKL